MFVSSRINPTVRTIPVGATNVVYDATFFPLPATMWVRPGAGETLTISYSTDGGTNYQSLTALTGAAAYTEVQVNAGFTNLKITSAPGSTAGTWGVC